MGFADQYLNRNPSPFTSALDPSLVGDTSIVIPCFNEYNLTHTLESLYNCHPGTFSMNVIVVVNAAETSAAEIIRQNRQTAAEASAWFKTRRSKPFQLKILEFNQIPERLAGAGMARKIGMDYAVSLFNASRNPDGIIISLDADCAVAENYAAAIKEAYRANKDTTNTVIHFEHPFEALSEDSPERLAIVQYELHMRCHIGHMRRIGYPFAYHTVGSAFSVKASTYCQQGGMNRRKAGEDFYFLHKLFPLSQTAEINYTTVYPSPRISLRNPFGTGPALVKIINAENTQLNTYNPLAYDDLGCLVALAASLYQQTTEEVKRRVNNLPAALLHYLAREDFYSKIEGINKNTATLLSFLKRFYRVFDFLFAVKYLNYASRSTRQDVPVTQSAIQLLAQKSFDGICIEDLLKHLRSLQKQSSYLSPL